MTDPIVVDSLCIYQKHHLLCYNHVPNITCWFVVGGGCQGQGCGQGMVQDHDLRQ